MMRLWRLTSVCLSVAYIRPKSRTESSRKTKIGTEVGHLAPDWDAAFKVKRSKVNLQGRGILWRSPAQLFITAEATAFCAYPELAIDWPLNRRNTIFCCVAHSGTCRPPTSYIELMCDWAEHCVLWSAHVARVVSYVHWWYVCQRAQRNNRSNDFDPH